MDDHAHSDDSEANRHQAAGLTGESGAAQSPCGDWSRITLFEGWRLCIRCQVTVPVTECISGSRISVTLYFDLVSLCIYDLWWG